MAFWNQILQKPRRFSQTVQILRFGEMCSLCKQSQRTVLYSKCIVCLCAFVCMAATRWKFLVFTWWSRKASRQIMCCLTVSRNWTDRLGGAVRSLYVHSLMVLMCRAHPERTALSPRWDSIVLFLSCRSSRPLWLPRRDHPQAQSHVGCQQGAARQQQEETNQLALLTVRYHSNQRGLKQSVQHPLTVESEARHRVHHR